MRWPSPDLAGCRGRSGKAQQQRPPSIDRNQHSFRFRLQRRSLGSSLEPLGCLVLPSSPRKTRRRVNCQRAPRTAQGGHRAPGGPRMWAESPAVNAQWGFRIRGGPLRGLIARAAAQSPSPLGGSFPSRRSGGTRRCVTGRPAGPTADSLFGHCRALRCVKDDAVVVSPQDPDRGERISACASRRDDRGRAVRYKSRRTY